MTWFFLFMYYLSISIIMNVYACPLQCLCRNEEVHCGNRFLSSIPRNIPADTKYLYLNGNFIKRVHQEELKQLANLQVLGMSSNKIQHIEKSAFHYLKSLKTLILSDNPIGAINKDLFDNLDNLERLGLTRIHNSTSLIINDYSFHDLHKLQELKLDQNKLISIKNETFQGLSSLKYLDISYNNLMIIDSASFQPFRDTTILIIGNEMLLCCCHTVSAFFHNGIRTIGYCLNQITSFTRDCDDTSSICNATIRSTGEITIPKKEKLIAVVQPTTSYLDTFKTIKVLPSISISVTKSFKEHPHSSSVSNLTLSNINSNSTLNNTCNILCDNTKCLTKTLVCKKSPDHGISYSWVITAVVTVLSALSCYVIVFAVCIKIRNESGLYILPRKIPDSDNT